LFAREAEGREFDSEMAGLQENKKKLDREIRNMEALLDGSKNKVIIDEICAELQNWFAKNIFF
jgi:hypothetical protein